MQDLDLKVLGTRLKRMREMLELSQKDIACKIDCKQSAISNLELGKGGSIFIFLKLLNYYSSFFYIDLIFSDDFYLVEVNNNTNSNKVLMDKVISSLLNDLELKHKAALIDLSENLKKVAALVH